MHRLEARLLGHDSENEDCLVRCLSCHKEVIDLQSLDTATDSEEVNSHLKKVNPGPSSAKVYRSNVPFSAEPNGGAFDTYTSDPLPDVAQSNVVERGDTQSLTRRTSQMAKATPIRYIRKLSLFRVRILIAFGLCRP